MSIQFRKDNCVFLSHKECVDRIYQSNYTLDCTLNTEKQSFVLKSNLFNINSCYLRDNQKSSTESTIPDRNRSKINKKKEQIEIGKNPEQYTLIQEISARTKTFIELCRSEGLLLSPETRTADADNSEAQDLSREVLSAESDSTQILNGRNTESYSVIYTDGDNERFLIPPHCKFIKEDVRKALSSIDLRNDPDLIVMDPPWWNKYIRRVKTASSTAGYAMLDKDGMLNMPIERFVCPNTLVAIWCTNSPSHIASIHTELLPRWGLKLLATWYWIKVTKYGDTVCEFGLPLRKQPFEQLFIACHTDSDRFKELESPRYLYSIPSAIHSHKPPLIDLLAEYLPQSPRCLEIFARYLLPNFTSVGIEVLKLQNLKLFDKINLTQL